MYICIYILSLSSFSQHRLLHPGCTGNKDPLPQTPPTLTPSQNSQQTPPPPPPPVCCAGVCVQCQDCRQESSLAFQRVSLQVYSGTSLTRLYTSNTDTNGAEVLVRCIPCNQLFCNIHTVVLSVLWNQAHSYIEYRNKTSLCVSIPYSLKLLPICGVWIFLLVSYGLRHLGMSSTVMFVYISACIHSVGAVSLILVVSSKEITILSYDWSPFACCLLVRFTTQHYSIYVLCH